MYSRLQAIKQALSGLKPSMLEIIDESEDHIGHAGALDGRGHFRIKIASEQFKGLSRVAQHRLIYQNIGELMQTDIHALAIEIIE